MRAIDKEMIETGEHIYMEPNNGELATYDGWDYTDETGTRVNAVDLGEVVPVVWDVEAGYWREV